MARTAIGFFLIVLIASLISSVIGGLFAMAVAWISPDFVSGLFCIRPEQHIDVSRYAFSIGMIWGVFMGAGVAGFCCLLSVVIKLIRLRIDHRTGAKPQS